MPKTQCCAVGCQNRGGFRFPGDKKLKKKWILNIRRKKWKPTEHSVVCYVHFDPQDLIATSSSTGLHLLCRKLKVTAVPKHFQYNKKSNSKAIETNSRQQRYLGRQFPLHVSTTDIAEESFAKDETCEDVPLLTIPEHCNEVEVLYDDTKSEIDTDHAQLSSMPTKLLARGTQTLSRNEYLGIDKLKDNAAMLHFYTGLEDYDKFCLVFDTLQESATSLKYKWNRCCVLTLEDQFLLTIIKLRRYMCDLELGFLFGMSVHSVSNVFHTWINFISCQWREIDIWPSRDLVSYYMPADFKSTFPSTRVILDGTEVPIQKPGNPTSQKATFSTYKNRNTIKVIVGITPGGLISYVSPAYAGSTSDRQIIERSDLMTKCEMGDSVMADRGINVQDLFAPYDIKVNIPTFMKGKNQLPGLTVVNDRKVAGKRVHVERLIGLGKTYKILRGPLNKRETLLGSEIIFVCFMLSNFRNCVVGKNV